MAIYSPLQFSDNNLLPIALLAASGLLLLIIVYYIVISKTPSKRGELYNVKQSQHSTDMAAVMSSTVNDLKPVPTGAPYSLVPNPSITPNVTVPKTPEVFNIKENIYTIDDAPAVCGALGAQVATIEQLIQAHKNGADWCNVGWTKDGIAAYPIQQSTFDIMQQNDPEKRNMYDRYGYESLDQFGPPPDFSTFDFSSLFGGATFTSFNFQSDSTGAATGTDMFSNLFSGFTKKDLDIK